jgi:PAS domain S-box-containing protein
MNTGDRKRAPAGGKSRESLGRRIEELEARLAETEETLLAIRTGAVDAVVVSTEEGERLFTLSGAETAYRVFLEAIGEGALTVTREGLILYANRRFAEIAGRRLEKVIGASISRFTAPEDRRALEALLLAGTSGDARREVSLRCDEGKSVPVIVSVSLLPDSDPPALCLVISDLTEQKKVEAELTRHKEHLEELVRERTFQLETANAQLHAEVTERKRAEKALKATVGEKDVLMRELAHRTKNNMQVIGNLLTLQAAALEDETLLRALADTQDRIRAMALVHENLFRTGTIASLNLRGYVEDLVESLLRAHQMAGRAVTSSLDVDELSFSIDAAVPCGLIINELISNSLKHAFRDVKSGEIFLSLRRVGEKVELRYRDDGPGLPPGLDLSKIKSLGLKLVYNLAVRQLRGTMELRSGTVSEFVFTLGGFTHTEGTQALAK